MNIEIIEKHVGWIHNTVLSGRPTKILDLGCGPGLYISRLAKLGHECTGIDFSPASITYAREYAHVSKLQCSYIQQDIRAAEFGIGYGLVMFIFGEFNTFQYNDARLILEKAHRALAEKGSLLFEVHTFDAVRAIGEQPSSWYATESGLFSDQPHICLTENIWEPKQQAATVRYFILDGLTCEVTCYASSTQAYSNEQYRSLLEECGFGGITFHSSLSGEIDESQRDFIGIVCQKRSVVK